MACRHGEPSAGMLNVVDSADTATLARVTQVSLIVSDERADQAYGGRVTALAQLTVDVPAGVVGLVGANGAGKATLLKILLGLLPRDPGTAQVLGLDVGTEARRIRELVGYMPEHDCLPPDVSATELVVHLRGCPGCRRRRRASAPPTCCVTSASTRSATARSAGTPPA